jgi:DNA polymerase
MNKNKFFKQLERQVKTCQKCPLYKNRTKAVFGSGKISSKIMLIGESPGKEEDIQGIPFVGKAGKILDDLLKIANINRNKVFITNLVKCHPLKNRDPQKEEIQKCSYYLEKQIDLIKPTYIITLGRFASKYLFKKFNIPFTQISKIHGKPYKITYNNYHFTIISMYHPAYALYDKKKKKLFEKDFQKITI